MSFIGNPKFIGLLGDESSVWRNGSVSIKIFGHPMFPSEDIDATGLRLLAKENITGKETNQILQKLNGSFVIIVTGPDYVKIFNDRFSSIPIFYRLANGTLTVSTNYLEMLTDTSLQSQNKLLSQSVLEFIYFQRLHGSDTFHPDIKFLDSASNFTYNTHTCHISLDKYWAPDFSKSDDPENDLAVELAEALQKSVRRRISGCESSGLLLSGGLDSRAILAAFPDDIKPHCYTIGDLKNNEVMVAEQVANAAGCEWQFIGRDVQHYANIMKEAVLLGAGMYVFNHGHFFNFDWGASSKLFHGHGLDYFFQGMYLPSKNFKIFGGDTYYKNLTKLDPKILLDTYVNSAKFRLKNEALNGVMRSNVRDELLGNIKSKLASIVNTIADDAAEIYDMWDYLYLHNPSRHYTYLNVMSMNSESSNQITAAFDNDVYDQYFKMPADMRMNGNVYIKSIIHMNSSLMNVRTANTNMIVEPSVTRMTVKAVKRKILRVSGLKNRDLQYPTKKDTSWPTAYNLVNDSRELRQKTISLIDSDALDSLNIFDMDSLKLVVEDQLSNKCDNGSLILTLLTVQEFIKQMDLGVSLE